MTEHSPNLERGKAMQVQEAQRVRIKMNLKRPTPRHITVKMPNVKDSKGETASNIQRSSNKSINGFLNRHTRGQKGLAQNIPDNQRQGHII